MAQLFLKNPHPEVCTSYLSQFSSTEIFTKLNSGWYYMVPKDTAMSINCPQSNSHHTYLKRGTGFVAFPLNCQIATQKTLVPASNSIVGAKYANNATIIPYHFNTNQSKIKFDEIFQDENLPLELSKFTNQSIPIVNLQNRLKAVNLQKKIMHKQHYITYTSIGLGSTSLIILLVLGLILIFIYLVFY